MYFCNMLGENANVKLDSLAENINTPSNDEEFVRSARIAYQDGKLIVNESGDCKDLFELKSYDGIEEELEKYKLECTFEQLKDSEENPLIVVLASAIHFYQGIPTLIRYINVSKDAVLACLVSGMCAFEFSDGEIVDMGRCCSKDVIPAKKIRFSGDKLSSVSLITDKESDSDISSYCVNSIIVSIKGKDLSCKYRTVKPLVQVFNTERVLYLRKKHKAHLEKLETLRRLELEKRKKAEMEYQEKKKKEREEMEVVDKGYVSVGADSFMRAIRGLH